jgi:aspartyl-tRNA(Asn)/glutamyl-tRNA(Gln) amidotransferase subunit C
MIKISKKDVENVALLARLDLDEEEKEMFPGQLSNVLEHIDKLSKLKTDAVDFLSDSQVTRDQLREDVLRPSFFSDDLLKNAPEQDKGHFKVPKIIE